MWKFDAWLQSEMLIAYSVLFFKVKRSEGSLRVCTSGVGEFTELILTTKYWLTSTLLLELQWIVKLKVLSLFSYWVIIKEIGKELSTRYIIQK